ncbi:CMP/dCMP deaminase zinc-binding [Dethiosulfovibrio peptidovorans DSM 11002]|uniref:CMP/dCMP deaminase zinc-binding n=1 Tax=Dethiosulfovibrio peptidovorans DSM 11002 TaxID=469381 RepID=D2Z8Q5_9BACT|nr:nucleoside deaminase [Dethiosulfovibrio peptidovorans]EFC91852.1 CMP/dCMP deaminase zinc-binding [Dethiosulfovibrio peptidovorans DSM 11002]
MEADVIFNRMLDVIERDVVPLTRKGVEEGHKVFGAAILKKDDLSLVVAGTNHELECPLWHGEVYTIKKFYEMSNRPDPKDCVFLSTHEPCSMCLSAIAWAGFPEFYFLFSYDDTKNAFSIPHDIKMLKEVFECDAPTRENSFYRAHPLMDMVPDLDDPDDAKERISRIQCEYDSMSSLYQSRKDTNSIPLK